MREILFRGKRADNGEWVEGYLYITQNGQYEISNYCKQYAWERYTYIVIPETVGQYTGLLDKNGKKIFEGDILKIKSCDYDYEYTTQVYYSCHTLCVNIYGQDYDSTAISFADDIWDEECCEVEVIGNIYDNPELLGEERKG